MEAVCLDFSGKGSSVCAKLAKLEPTTKLYVFGHVQWDVDSVANSKLVHVSRPQAEASKSIVMFGCGMGLWVGLGSRPIQPKLRLNNQ